MPEGRLVFAARSLSRAAAIAEAVSPPTAIYAALMDAALVPVWASFTAQTLPAVGALAAIVTVSCDTGALDAPNAKPESLMVNTCEEVSCTVNTPALAEPSVYRVTPAAVSDCCRLATRPAATIWEALA